MSRRLIVEEVTPRQYAVRFDNGTDESRYTGSLGFDEMLGVAAAFALRPGPPLPYMRGGYARVQAQARKWGHLDELAALERLHDAYPDGRVLLTHRIVAEVMG